MENTTAMQDYIQWLANLKECDPSLSPTITLMEQKANELLPKDQQVIEAAWNIGNRFDKYESANDYYTQKYGVKIPTVIKEKPKCPHCSSEDICWDDIQGYCRSCKQMF